MKMKGNLMPTGRVRAFDKVKRYGFITSDEGKKDLLVHMNSLQKAGVTFLVKNQRVEYVEQVQDNGKLIAKKIKLLD
jgi:CspA family cold shock protein